MLAEAWVHVRQVVGDVVGRAEVLANKTGCLTGIIAGLRWWCWHVCNA